MHNLANATHPTWAPFWQKTLWSLFLVVWCGILGATAAWAATDFVVLGHEGIWVRQGSTVVSGDVGANVASVGPFLAGDQEVTIGKNVVVQDPTSRVLGDTMRLKSGSQVQDAFLSVVIIVSCYNVSPVGRNRGSSFP